MTGQRWLSDGNFVANVELFFRRDHSPFKRDFPPPGRLVTWRRRMFRKSRRGATSRIPCRSSCRESPVVGRIGMDAFSIDLLIVPITMQPAARRRTSLGWKIQLKARVVWAVIDRRESACVLDWPGIDDRRGSPRFHGSVFGKAQALAVVIVPVRLSIGLNFFF